MKKLEKELSGEVMVVDLPQHLRQSITQDVIQRLKSLGADANITEQSGECEFVYVTIFINIGPFCFSIVQLCCSSVNWWSIEMVKIQLLNVFYSMEITVRSKA